MADIHTFPTSQDVDVQRQHTQTEINRRLYRAHNLAHFLQLDLRQMDIGTTPLWLPSALDYLADDLAELQSLTSNIHPSS